MFDQLAEILSWTPAKVSPVSPSCYDMTMRHQRFVFWIGMALLVLQPATSSGSDTKTSHTKAKGTPRPVYSRDISQILQKRCISCHSDSKIAPFSLVGYSNAKSRANSIVSVTASNYMPPWKAKNGYGEFRDSPALTAEEKMQLALWAKSNAPQGDPTSAPTSPSVAPGWRLGKPDLVVAPSKPTRIPSEGRDFFRDYLIDPHVTKPTWVKTIDFRPSNQGTVHHIIPSLLEKTEVEKLKKIKYDYTDESWNQNSIDEIKTYNTLGFWSTGAPPFESPSKTGFLINPGDCILLDVHYKPKGKPELEQPEVAFYFHPEPPLKQMSVKVVATGDIYLQPGESNGRAFAISDKLKEPAIIYAIWPHMHYCGRKFKAWVKFPAGYSKPLVAIDDWDPDWQLIYYLKTPMKVPAGSKIYVSGIYDNTAGNPRNPNNPPKVIESGESSRDEMLFFELFWVVDKLKVSKR